MYIHSPLSLLYMHRFVLRLPLASDGAFLQGLLRFQTELVASVSSLAVGHPTAARQRRTLQLLYDSWESAEYSMHRCFKFELKINSVSK